MTCSEAAQSSELGDVQVSSNLPFRTRHEKQWEMMLMLLLLLLLLLLLRIPRPELNELIPASILHFEGHTRADASSVNWYALAVRVAPGHNINGDQHRGHDFHQGGVSTTSTTRSGLKQSSRTPDSSARGRQQNIAPHLKASDVGLSGTSSNKAKLKVCPVIAPGSHLSGSLIRRQSGLQT